MLCYHGDHKTTKDQRSAIPFKSCTDKFVVVERPEKEELGWMAVVVIYFVVVIALAVGLFFLDKSGHLCCKKDQVQPSV